MRAVSLVATSGYLVPGIVLMPEQRDYRYAGMICTPTIKMNSHFIHEKNNFQVYCTDKVELSIDYRYASRS